MQMSSRRFVARSFADDLRPLARRPFCLTVFYRVFFLRLRSICSVIAFTVSFPVGPRVTFFDKTLRRRRDVFWLELPD